MPDGFERGPPVREDAGHKLLKKISVLPFSLKPERELFIGAGNHQWVSQKREYVFTEWDPTAQTDMQALRARFGQRAFATQRL